MKTRYVNNVGPQVRRYRYARGWSQTDLAAKLQIAGLDISRGTLAKVEARIRYVDDRTLTYLAEVLKVQVQDLFPPREDGRRLHEFMEHLDATRFQQDESFLNDVSEPPSLSSTVSALDLLIPSHSNQSCQDLRFRLMVSGFL